MLFLNTNIQVKFIRLIISLLFITPFCVCKSQTPLKFSSSQSFTQPLLQQATIKDNSSIKSEITSFNSEGVFTSKDKRIGFILRLSNQLKESQVGNILFQLINSSGAILYKENIPFSLNKKGSFSKNFEFANGQFQPGFYMANMKLVSNYFEDNIIYNFGYEPTKIVTTTNIPVDFVNFWENSKRELVQVNPNFSNIPRPDLSNKHVDVYEIQFNSIDKAIIKGWLSVPKSGNKNPILFKVSDYLSEQQPELRRETAVLALNLRGVGGSATNYNLPYDQYGIYNLQDKNRYIFKGIYLDVLRGVDFLTNNYAAFRIDPNKIILSGTGLGASAVTAVAALDSRVKAIVLETPSFVDMKDMLNFGEAVANPTWPTSMFKSFYTNRRIGTNRESMLRTLNYFDPVNFAPFLTCPILIGFNLRSNVSPAHCVYNFISQLRVTKKEVHTCKDCTTTMDKAFYGLKETWLKEKFR